MNRPAPNQLWAYRAKQGAPLIKARVIDVDVSRRSARCTIEHLEGASSGLREHVPATRLKVEWGDVESFRAWEEDEASLAADCDLTEVEELALEAVFELLVPDEAASLRWRPVSVTIHDGAAMDRLLGVPYRSLVAGCRIVEMGGQVRVSGNGTARLAEQLCRAQPQPVLDLVRAQEEKAEQACVRGRPTSNSLHGPYVSDPESEWRSYRDFERPRHEALRSWCGVRAVSSYDRAEAAEAEAIRVKRLLADALDDLQRHDEDAARRHRVDLFSGEVTGHAGRAIPVEPRRPQQVIITVPQRRYWG